MNLHSPIGGYFELEMRQGGFVHDDALLLNSGRSCFEYILRAQKASHVYIPKYTCDVMLEPLARLGISYAFYSINDKLEAADEKIILKDGEMIVYTNYFGIKGHYSRLVAKTYGNKAIIDSSQGYYFEPLEKGEGHTFYSPRKFFGVPDGGCLYTDALLETGLQQDVSTHRFSHLIRRIDEGAEDAYSDFKNNDKSLSGESVKYMSNLTRRLLSNIDYESTKTKRLENFRTLHESLGPRNELEVSLDSSEIPMTYPFRTRDSKLLQKLIDNKVFVATYWPNVLEWCKPEETEYRLAESILPLPIDQRYGRAEMDIILGLINE